MKIINDILEDYKNREIPGLAISYIGIDGTVVNGYCGYADLRNNVKISPATRFNLASAGKTITAAAMFLLQKDRKLSLNDFILDYIPELGQVYKKVRIQHLVNHSSGLKDYYGPLSGKGKKIFNRDVINFLTEQDRLDFEPNTGVDYINSGYVLLAEVIARVSGLGYSDYLQTNIFRPLGMDNSFVNCGDESVRTEIAEGYRFSDNEIASVDNEMFTCGDSNIFSNLDDMVLWVKAVTGRHFFSSSDKEQLFKTYALENRSEIAFRSAWIPRSDNGNDVLEIMGGVPGYGSLISLFLDEGYALVLLSNNNDRRLWGKSLDKLFNTI